MSGANLFCAANHVRTVQVSWIQRRFQIGFAIPKPDDAEMDRMMPHVASASEIPIRFPKHIFRAKKSTVLWELRSFGCRLPKSLEPRHRHTNVFWDSRPAILFTHKGPRGEGASQAQAVPGRCPCLTEVGNGGLAVHST